MATRELKRIKKTNLDEISHAVPMNGEEIAKALGVTRQNVSNVLKRAMKKVYFETGDLDPTWSPFQVVTVIAQMFKITNQSDISKFFALFPPDIKEEIETDAKKYMRNI